MKRLYSLICEINYFKKMLKSEIEKDLLVLLLDQKLVVIKGKYVKLSSEGIKVITRFP